MFKCDRGRASRKYQHSDQAPGQLPPAELLKSPDLLDPSVQHQTISYFPPLGGCIGVAVRRKAEQVAQARASSWHGRETEELRLRDIAQPGGFRRLFVQQTVEGDRAEKRKEDNCVRDVPAQIINTFIYLYLPLYP